MRSFLLVGRIVSFPFRALLGLVLRRPLSRATEDLSASGERILIPPAPAKFTGAFWGRRPRGDGIIALTENALRFWPVFGRPILIPRGEIQGVEVADWFQGYWRAGSRHLVLELSGKRRIGFIVPSPEEWVQALRRN